MKRSYIVIALEWSLNDDGISEPCSGKGILWTTLDLSGIGKTIWKTVAASYNESKRVRVPHRVQRVAHFWSSIILFVIEV